ncbi:MAG: DedA family protein [Verrucomicrobia bacterium]|nr:DedA family protein [Verrucomicrobiota bacterium]
MDSAGESPLILPFGFEDWPPIFQVLFFTATAFISEDATMITAAVLAGTGQISRMVAFLGAFFGIWIGDFILFAIAWNLRSWSQSNGWARKFLAKQSFSRYEDWFARKGWRVLVICRFLPGTRLSCFMAAGYLRMSPWLFGFTTFLCALIWALVIFAIFERVGHAYIGYLNQFYQAAWFLIFLIISGILLLKLISSLSHPDGRRSWAVRLAKCLRWEFWPGWIIYTPCFFYYLLLAIRFRSLTLPTIANPGMENGGFIGESKSQILRSIANTGTPAHLPFDLIPEGDNLESRFGILQAWMLRDCVDWPVILKPDLGQRGMGVRLAQSADHAREYLLQNPHSNIICQQTATGQREAGIFYIRIPGHSQGHIFAATEKIFPHLVGNGVDPIRKLIWSHPRARFQYKVFFKRFANQLDDIPAAGQSIPLVFAGNHAQGALFLDGQRWITPELTQSIDSLSQSIPGFHFGRFDIRFENEIDLMLGRGYQIIELNGASSEATNIYDPQHSIWFAWRTLFKQWHLAFLCGNANRSLGHKPVPFLEWCKFYHKFNKKYQQLSVSD